MAAAPSPAAARPRRSLPLAALLACTLALAPGSAVAAGSPRDESRAAFAAGADAFESGRAKEALGLFLHAYALFPHPSIFYNIGVCERALGHPIEAAAALHRYLDESGAQVPAARRAATLELLGEVEGKVATATLRVTPRGHVTIDGKPAPVDAVRVNPGEHELAATAEGFTPGRTTFIAPLGGKVTVELALAPAPSTAPLPGAGAAEPAAEPRFNALFWSLSGLSLAGVAAGAVTGSLALADAAAYRSAATSDADAQQHRSRGQVLRVVADVSFGTALACAVGAVLVATRSAASRPAPKAALALVPALGPRAASLGLAGRF